MKIFEQLYDSGNQEKNHDDRFGMILPKRICIYPKDVQNITGRKEQTARRLYNQIKKELGKPKEGFVTVQEFCKFTGISEEEVYRFMVD